MGQKIHPYGLRLGIVTDWTSRWYSDKDYATNVAEDHKIRTYLQGELKRGAVSRIDIERIGDKKVQVDIHTGRPGVVIGRGGSEAERLRAGLEKISGRRVKFNVIEVHNAELDATLLARSVADQLEGRVSFRRALKRTVATALKAGAEGVRVQASGRLGGADMGRREWYLEGRVPLHTLRADIDYGQATAATTVGAIGIKVWVYKGDIMARTSSSDRAAAEARLAAGGAKDRHRRRSVKSRAEAAAGGSETRIIEAGGGKRVIEAGGGKRAAGGKRIIEAGGGRKVTAADASAELAEAREAVAGDSEKPEEQLTADSSQPEAVDSQKPEEQLTADSSQPEAVDSQKPEEVDSQKPEEQLTADSSQPEAVDSQKPEEQLTADSPQPEAVDSQPAEKADSPQPTADSPQPEAVDGEQSAVDSRQSEETVDDSGGEG